MNDFAAATLLKELGGFTNAQAIKKGIVFPCIGYDLLGHNYIHKQCEHAPTRYSPEHNSWSEDYAVGKVVSAEEIEQAIGVMALKTTWVA